VIKRLEDLVSAQQKERKDLQEWSKKELEKLNKELKELKK